MTIPHSLPGISRAFNSPLSMGDRRERGFVSWMNSNRIYFTGCDQRPEKYAEAFRGTIKRPDYTVWVPPTNTCIAVDVKCQEPHVVFNTFTVSATEVQLLSGYQNLSHLCVWIVFTTPAARFKTWFWIPLSEITKVGIERVANATQARFFVIRASQCRSIASLHALSNLIHEGYNR